MTFTEVKQDLFAVDASYYLAHCVAGDLAMGKGVAVPMNEKYDLRRQIWDSSASTQFPTCILTGRVFNLVTKQRSWMKPTMGDFLITVGMMKEQAVALGVKKIAMPRIGCGLDRLAWSEVSDSIKKIFLDTDIEILVCSL